NRNIHVLDAGAGLRREFGGMTEKAFGVRAFPLWIAGWEVRADIAFAERAEDGVHERVPAGVCIRVTDETLVVGDPNAAERDVVAIAKAMRVKARADARRPIVG